jgi:signal transduction histidine kinase
MFESCNAVERVPVGLAQFILGNIEPILADWETFARSLPPGKHMSRRALRDDAKRMLRFVAADMVGDQSEREQAAKGRGEGTPANDDTAAEIHGGLRLTQAFDLAEMVAEFRALRASVLRLWACQPGAVPPSAMELIRFNEAIDQILAESVRSYAKNLERSRELLLAVLGHDLRNPLSSISMSAAVLARTALAPRQIDLVAAITRGAGRMSKMVNDLLDFTRTRLGADLVISAEHCDLAAVCRSIADESRSARPECEVAGESSGNCVGCWDCARMAQLFSNLVGNAVQHGVRNTPINIAVAGEEDDWVAAVVRNQGPPIPAERRSSLFSPLNRSTHAHEHDLGGSLGLGLYIAKEIASAHGGGIELLSSDGAGTSFEVRLPRTMETQRVAM